jgi:hypothetical protein
MLPSGRQTVALVDCDAIVFGQWAAHGDGDDGWSVTHVPSGIAAIQDLTRDDAIHVAVALTRFVPVMAVSAKDVLDGTFKAKMPTDLRWLFEAAFGEVLGGVEWYP